MNKDYLLSNELAKHLYYNYIKDLPIIDYHNHLLAAEILNDYQFQDLTDAWLANDHYKWRLMRNNNVSEDFITGNASSYEKFYSFCQTMEKAIGSPVLVWSQIELKMFFDLDLAINRVNAKTIFETVNQKLASNNYNANFFLNKANVEVLCTTDSPLDDLANHQAIATKGLPFLVLPTFRPDQLLQFGTAEFNKCFVILEQLVGYEITSFKSYCKAIEERLQYFIKSGCKLSDHGLDVVVSIDETFIKLDEALMLSKVGKSSSFENQQLKNHTLIFLLNLYAKYDIKTQIHLGAIRNVNEKLFQKLGRDSGLDSINNNIDINALARLFNQVNQLPDIVLYNLNPSDNYKIASFCQNFITKSGTIKYGAAWWFNDTDLGIINQMTTLAKTGLLGNFLGMLTDSRSILSISRHDYFRRLLCSFLATNANDDSYFDSKAALGALAVQISYGNIKKFLNLD